MNPIGAKWDLFVGAVLPTDAPPVQKQEMRRAFYAGAEAVLDQLMGMADTDTLGEEPGVEMLTAMGTELVQFAADVLGGRA